MAPVPPRLFLLGCLGTFDFDPLVMVMEWSLVPDLRRTTRCARGDLTPCVLRLPAVLPAEVIVLARLLLMATGSRSRRRTRG